MITPCRMTTQLALTQGAAGRARQFVREQLTYRVSEHVADVAVLLTSELVTNVARHAHTKIELAVLLEPREVCVEVADQCPTPPVIRRKGISSSRGGWGMHLVSALSDCWGVVAHPGGKAVWFRLGTDPKHA
jgi:anti-sigma regulatory factor (Ser/Thr protein kinase)